MTCEECGATWRRSARFCGRCGALLRPVAPPAETTRRRADPGQRRWIAAGCAAGCLVVLGAVASFVGQPWETPAAAPSQDVEVPATPEGEAPDAERDRATPWEPPAPAVLCQPAPCELWRIHLPSGTSVVDGDTAYHVGSTNWRTELTAIDIASGAVRWRETLAVPDAVNGERLDLPAPPPFTGRDGIIVVGTEGRLQARASSDGATTWTFDRDGLLPYSLEAGPDDAIIVLAGKREDPPSSEPGWSSEVILSVDASTGELRWEREIIWPLSLGPYPEGVILVSAEWPDEPQGTPVIGNLQALDASTGETLWHRPAPQHGFGASGSVVRVYDGEGSEFWDIHTGEPLALPIPDALGDDVDVEVVGNLIAVRSYPDGDETATPLPDPQRQHLSVFDRTEGLERFTTTADGWVGMEGLADGGAVVLSGEGQQLDLTRLGADGQPRWTREFATPPVTYWPRWPELLPDGTITIIASAEPDLANLAMHHIDPGSGETLAAFHLDVDTGQVEPHDLEIRWPTVVEHHANRLERRLHGPGGSLQLTRGVHVVSVQPLVVQSSSGTLARLDEEVLFGSS